MIPDSLLARIDGLLEARDRVIVAIDGGSASGKSTLAEALAGRYGAALLHMDDFFMPPALRTPQRLEEPGGNVHRERFLAEALLPLRAGEAAAFRPFDCGVMDFAPVLAVPPARLCIVEGAYAHHPDLRGHYDLTVFLAVDPQLQRQRVLARNRDMAARFFEAWIPIENTYFRHFGIAEAADLVIPINEERPR